MSGRSRSGGPDGGRRQSHVSVRSTAKRSASSRRWLERQLNDPYVAEAQRRGYRARSAFKLIEIDDRFRLLRPGVTVVDLGAAPGSWTQVAAARVRAGRPGGGRVLAIDLLPIEPIAGAEVLEGDLLDEEMATTLMTRLDGRVGVVLSDMAPAASGHAGADHIRIMALAEAALGVAFETLRPGGGFVCKVFQGGTEARLLAEVKRRFAMVRHVKPPASRPDSAEIYLVAQGFRGD